MDSVAVVVEVVDMEGLRRRGVDRITARTGSVRVMLVMHRLLRRMRSVVRAIVGRGGAELE